MFRGKLYVDAEGDARPRFWIYDSVVGRRVEVELEMRGANVIAVPFDRGEFEEPPISDPHPPVTAGDPRRAPIDPDDFRDRTPEPV